MIKRLTHTTCDICGCEVTTQLPRKETRAYLRRQGWTITEHNVFVCARCKREALVNDPLKVKIGTVKFRAKLAARETAT